MKWYTKYRMLIRWLTNCRMLQCEQEYLNRSLENEINHSILYFFLYNNEKFSSFGSLSEIGK